MHSDIAVNIAGSDERSLLADLARNGNDSPYDLLTVLDEKCFGPGFAGPSQVLLARTATDPVGFAVVCGRHIRLLLVDRKHRRTGVGSTLLREAERHIAKGGKIRADLAAEAGNYFVPGLLESEPGLRNFFERRGYVAGDTTSNLECALSGSAFLEGENDRAVRRVEAADRAEVTRFIEQDFGRIWAFETQSALRSDSPTVFIAEINGRIAGFSAHDANNRKLGFFGPTGVHPPDRGKGLGRALLLASLRDLRDLGFQHAVIPWTDALEFYRKSCGAFVRHRFVAYSRTL